MVRRQIGIVGAAVALAMVWLAPDAGAAGWARQATANPGDAKLNSVSCVADASHAGPDCMAAGVKVDSVGNNDAIALYWNGTTWGPVMVPSIPFAPQSTFTAVACPAPGTCLAVGFEQDDGIDHPVAELWSRDSWTNKPVPVPPDVMGGTLSGISCTSASACTVVGTVNHYSGAPDTPLVDQWDGHSFTVKTVLLPSGTSHGWLDGVSCHGANWCMAVGGAGRGELLTARWNGSSWSSQTVPTASVLQAVSCPTTTWCAAAGTAGGGGPGAALVSIWNGTGWRASAAPVIAGTETAALSGLSCTGVGACTAVGSDTSSVKHLLAVRYNGSQWALESVPPPSATDSELDAVACITASECRAVGDYLDPGANHLTLAEAWTGPSWSVVKTPALSAPKLADLFSDSCRGPNWCVAVGQVESSGGTVKGLGEGWDGSSWQLLPAIAVPSGAQGTMLDSVSCPVIDACVAVGAWTRASDGHLLPLLESWNGHAWGLISTPDPHAALAQLEGVSCKSISQCRAVGFIETTLGGVSLPLGANVAGTAATLQTVPLSPQTQAAALHGVWCDASLNCIAAGNWDDGHREQSLYALFWMGAWRPDLPPPAPSSTQDEIRGLSCTSVVACVAVGWFDDSAGHTVPLGYNVVGVGWTPTSPAPPPGASASGLAAVSCPTTSACMAVGYSHNATSDQTRTLAEMWNGSGWVPSPTPVPSVGDRQLYGISCSTATTCAAVGVAGSNQPLAEIYS